MYLYSFFAADLSEYNSEAWTKLGRFLHRLELVECSLAADAFHKIFRSCPRLRSLTLKGNRELSSKNCPDETYDML